MYGTEEIPDGWLLGVNYGDRRGSGGHHDWFPGHRVPVDSAGCLQIALSFGRAYMRACQRHCVILQPGSGYKASDEVPNERRIVMASSNRTGATFITAEGI